VCGGRGDRDNDNVEIEGSPYCIYKCPNIREIRGERLLRSESYRRATMAKTRGP